MPNELFGVKNNNDGFNKLNKIVIEYTNGISKRSESIRDSIGIITDEVTASYLRGQADAYEHCVADFMRRLKSGV